MDKKIKICLIVLVVIAIIAVIIFGMTSSEEQNEDKKMEVNSEEDLLLMIENVYDTVGRDSLPRVETTVIDVNDEDAVKMYTGLENGDDLEYLVVSQPLMSAQAYTFALAKVKEGKDANSISKLMMEQVDMRRWICVEAEKVYATNGGGEKGDIACIVMGEDEIAKEVFDTFKSKSTKTGKEYERSSEEFLLQNQLDEGGENELPTIVIQE